MLFKTSFESARATPASILYLEWLTRLYALDGGFSGLPINLSRIRWSSWVKKFFNWGRMYPEKEEMGFKGWNVWHCCRLNAFRKPFYCSSLNNLRAQWLHQKIKLILLLGMEMSLFANWRNTHPAFTERFWEMWLSRMLQLVKTLCTWVTVFLLNRLLQSSSRYIQEFEIGTIPKLPGFFMQKSATLSSYSLKLSAALLIHFAFFFSVIVFHSCRYLSAADWRSKFGSPACESIWC